MLDVQNLCVGLGGASSNPLVSDVSFSLKEDQCLGILGESGSGKSVTCNAINGLLPESFSVSGQVQFEGQDLLSMTPKQRNALRGKNIAMIMQSPMTAFNPLFTLGHQAVETIRHHQSSSKKEAKHLFAHVLRSVNLTSVESLLDKYPHQLSGGMLQRIMVAMALVLEPKLIIADEPTAGLDVSVQGEILNLLNKLKDDLGVSLFVITHNLNIVRHISDRTAVMYLGRFVEQGKTDDIFAKNR